MKGTLVHCKKTKAEISDFRVMQKNKAPTSQPE